MSAAQTPEEINVRRPSLRARDASTASMVNAIRRGSVKISWPIPASDDDHTLLTGQSPGPVTASSQATKVPVRPPRDDEGEQAAAAQTHGAIAPASSREALRPGHAPVKVYGVNPKHVGAGDPRSTLSNPPKRRGDSVRSIIRRFLRRSTVKEGRGSSGRLRKSPSETGRLGHHRSDPGASPLMGDGDGAQKKQPRSTSLPIKELREIGPLSRSRVDAGDPDIPQIEHAYEQGLDVEGGSSKPWQGMSPTSQFEDDPERPWQNMSPNVARWAGQNDTGLGTTWTGLAPRPASSYARRAGSHSPPPLRPEEIGLALPHGAANPRRRSRSAGELKTSYQLAGTQPERRMSEEIRYWRESVLAQPLSPVSNEKANEEVGESRPISYANGESDPEPQSTPADRLSVELEAPNDTEVVDLRRRVVELEAKVWHLQTAMAKIHRYLTEKHEGDPAVPDVLKHTLSRGSGETFSLSPKKALFHSHRAPAGRRARLQDIPSEVGMGPSPRASLDRISDSTPSVSHVSEEGSPGGLGVIHPIGQGDPESSAERNPSLSTITTTATSTTPRAEASNRPLTAFLGGKHAILKDDPTRRHRLDIEHIEGSEGPRNRPRPTVEEGSQSSDQHKREDDTFGLSHTSRHGNDDDVEDDGPDHDDDDDEEYTTTSETFITPTEDKTFAVSSPSSSSSSLGDDGGKEEPTTTGSLPTSTMRTWSPTSQPTITTAATTTTQSTTNPLPPSLTSNPSLPDPHHDPSEIHTAQPRLSLSQLTTNRSIILVPPSSSSPAAAPMPSTSF